MTIRIIVNGAQGKMGTLACETISKHPDFVLVAKLSRHDDLRQSIVHTKAQIVIDLTCADAVFANSLTIIESGAYPIIGSSGLLDNQIDTLTKRANERKLGGIIVPNFSLSAVLMMQFAAQAARYLSEVEIIEIHHPQKYDAPSGTAIKTAEIIAENCQINQQVHCNNELIPGVRGGKHRGVPIHSLRLSGVLAKQDIIFGSQGETLTLSHHSIDRISFMPGLILCCQKVLYLDKLYYGLEHLIA